MNNLFSKKIHKDEIIKSCNKKPIKNLTIKVITKKDKNTGKEYKIHDEKYIKARYYIVIAKVNNVINALPIQSLKDNEGKDKVYIENVHIKINLINKDSYIHINQIETFDPSCFIYEKRDMNNSKIKIPNNMRQEIIDKLSEHLFNQSNLRNSNDQAEKVKFLKSSITDKKTTIKLFIFLVIFIIVVAIVIVILMLYFSGKI